MSAALSFPNRIPGLANFSHQTSFVAQSGRWIDSYPRYQVHGADQVLPTVEVHYIAGFVIISVLISMGAAYAALSLADRMRASRSAWRRFLWLLGGSAAMGAGIWSMHYLGMLAVRLPVPVFFYWPMVLVSFLIAIGASALALIVVIRGKAGWRRLLAGGLLMGAGISGMHSIGMAAMRSSVMEKYNPWIIALSLVVVVGFSTVALWIGFAVRDSEQHGAGMLRVAGGCVMGLGIASMHYLAMSATHFVQSTAPFSLDGTVRISLLTQVGIATTTSMILLAALATAALEKRRFIDLMKAHAELRGAQQALLESERRLRAANEMLSELTLRDGLTGLHNRRHFNAALDMEWRRAARKGMPLAVLMIDVDCFKALNDRYGHQRGDECLCEIARVLEAGPRRSHDVVARYGGEEFVVLLPDADADAAMMIAELIRRAVRETRIENLGSAVAEVVTVSIGACSRTPQISEDYDGIIRDADAAMYAAKRAGKDRVELAARIAVLA
jgi:diguanylate cyclase (GGDEF)-like protein